MPSQELERLVRLKRHSYSTATSRSSISSSRRAVSDASMRKSASYKRNVSFQHHQRRSLGSGAGKGKVSSPQTLVSFDATSPERPSTSHTYGRPSESQSTPSLPTPPQLPRPRKPASELDMKKPRVASHYWKDETRKVSAELSKICEEAFNRSSISPFPARELQPADPLSIPIQVTDKSASHKRSEHLRNRPLPQPPPESLGSYTLRELAETRRRLLEHCDTSPGTVPQSLKEVISHLDRLLQLNGQRVDQPDKRSTSDPYPTTTWNSSHLAATSGEYGHTHESQSKRSASDPAKSTQKVTFEEGNKSTIRLVSPDPMSLISPIQPLNIRKGKPDIFLNPIRGRSTESLRSAHDRSGYDPRLYSGRALDTIEEDPKSPRRRGMVGSPSGSRKWSWFKRNSDQSDSNAPSPPEKNSPGLTANHELPPSASLASSTMSRVKSTTSSPGDGEELVERKKKWFQKMLGKSKVKGKQSYLANEHEILNELSETDSNSSMEHLMTEHEGARPKRIPRTVDTTKILADPSGSSVNAVGGKGGTTQNWFARFFHIKPATRVICLSVNKAKARREIMKILKDWRRYGLRDVASDRCTGAGDVLRGRVDAVNCECFVSAWRVC